MQLKDKGIEIAEAAKEQGKQLKDKTSKLYSELGEKLNEKVEDLKEAV